MEIIAFLMGLAGAAGIIINDDISGL